MYEIREREKELPDGTKITTYERDVISCNILEVEAGSTGYRGGDSGYGGRTYFRIEDQASTDIRVKPIGEKGKGGFEVFLGGDCELQTIIEALKFIAQALEDKAKDTTEYL